MVDALLAMSEIPMGCVRRMDAATDRIIAEFAIHAQRYDETSPPLADDDPLMDFLRARLAAGSRIVEFGAGTGRVSIPLVRQGYDVTGIDLSPDMVRRLAEKPEAARMTIIEGSFADRHDIGRCAAVLCVFNSLYHAHTREMQQAALRRAAEYLRPDGILVLENRSANSFIQEYSAGERVSVRSLTTDSAWLTAGTLSPLDQRVSIAHLAVTGGRFTYNPITLRYIWPDELRLMAETAGLEVVEEYADWHQSTFTAGSREHIAVLRRR